MSSTRTAHSFVNFVPVALVLLLILEAYLLVHDIFRLDSIIPTSWKDNSAYIHSTIAELVNSENSVKVQPPGDLVWDDAKSGQMLTRGEAVLTQERSRAEIAFIDGSGFIIGENAMVRLDRIPADCLNGGESIVLTLLRGTIRKTARVAKSKTKYKRLQLNVAATKALLSPETELTVTATPESAFFKVSAGQVSVNSGQQDVVVKQGEELEYSKDRQKLLPQTPLISLESPSSGEMIRIGDKTTSFFFKWKTDLDRVLSKSFVVQLSTDADFLKNEHKFSSQKHEIQVELANEKIIEGEWFWRVITVDDKARSQVGRFIVKGLEIPQPLFPVNTAKAHVNQDMDFIWTSVSDANEYEVLIEDKEEPLKKIYLRAEKNRMSGVRLGAGHYRWKVRAARKKSDAQAWSVWSKYYELMVAEKSLPLPPPPDDLLEPEFRPKKPRSVFQNGFEKIISSLFFNLAYADDLISGSILLRWTPVEGATKYRIQIARDSGFRRLIVETETAEAQWDWPYRAGMENTKGRAFYRVASVDFEGRVGPYSNYKIIPVRAMLGELKPKEVIVKTEVPVPQVEQQKWVVGSVLGIYGGLGGSGQKSNASDLVSVKTAAAFLQQKIDAQIKFGKEGGALWRFSVEAGAYSFKRLSTSLHTTQLKVSVYELSSSFYRELGPGNRPLVFELGVAADRSYRWKKKDPVTVDASSSFLVGPALSVAGKFRNGHWFIPVELGASVRAPMGAAFGVSGGVRSEWGLGVKLNRFRYIVETDASYLRWNEPKESVVKSWAVWNGITVSFGYI